MCGRRSTRGRHRKSPDRVGGGGVALGGDGDEVDEGGFGVEADDAVVRTAVICSGALELGSFGVVDAIFDGEVEGAAAVALAFEGVNGDMVADLGVLRAVGTDENEIVIRDIGERHGVHSSLWEL